MEMVVARDGPGMGMQVSCTYAILFLPRPRPRFLLYASPWCVFSRSRCATGSLVWVLSEVPDVASRY
jgi:hypothetical protein